MKKIIGELEVSNNVTINGKTVIKSNNGNTTDSNGNLNLINSGLLGNKGDIILFDDELYKTQPIVDYKKITNTNDELERQKVLSTDTIYDLFNNKTWNYSNNLWSSVDGITDLKIGILYSNTDTLKIYFVNDINDIKLVGGQTVGNNFGEIPSMNFFPSDLSDNGYQKLPSGLILQWGNISITNSGTFNFPIPFELYALGAFAINNNPTSNNNECIIPRVDYSMNSLTNINISICTVQGTSSMSMTPSGTTSVSVFVWGF